MSNRWAATLAVLAAAVLMTRCGGSSSSSSPTMPAPNPVPTGGGTADVVITINGIDGDMSFTPNPANVRPGQTVAWKNNGGTTHTATQDGGGFDTGAISNGATSAPIPMSTAGTYSYHCTFHPSMVGTVNVTTSGSGY